MKLEAAGERVAEVGHVFQGVIFKRCWPVSAEASNSLREGVEVKAPAQPSKS